MSPTRPCSPRILLRRFSARAGWGWVAACFVALAVAAGCVKPRWRYDRYQGLHDPLQTGKPRIATLYAEGYYRYRAAVALQGKDTTARDENLDAAAQRFRDAFELDPDSTYADKCLYFWAESRFLADRPDDAQQPAALLIEHYRDDSRGLGRSSDFPPRLFALLLARQEAYGSRLVSGKDTRGSPEDGVEILRAVAESDPHAAYADDAWMSIAAFHEASGNYEKALGIYDKVISNYVEADRWREAKFHKGRMHLALAKGIKYDGQPYRDARLALKEYLASDEPGRFQKEAKELLAEVQDLQARKILDVARFYYRQERYRGARHYLLMLTDRDRAADKALVDTPAAKEARELLPEIEALLEQENAGGGGKN